MAPIIKSLFVIINLLQFIFGSVIIGVVLWARFNNTFQKAVNSVGLSANDDPPLIINNIYIIIYILTGIGAIVMFCSFLGFCATIVKKPIIHLLYFFIILFLFLTKVGGSIYIIAKSTDSNQPPIIVSNLYIGASFVIGFGGILLLFGSIMGYCGVCAKHPIFFMISALVFLIILLTQLCGGLFIILKNDPQKENLKNWLSNIFLKGSKNWNLLSDIEDELDCCIIINERVYLNNENCLSNDCAEIIYISMIKNVTIVTAVSSCLIYIELFTMILAYKLYKKTWRIAHPFRTDQQSHQQQQSEAIRLSEIGGSVVDDTHSNTGNENSSDSSVSLH